MSQLNSKSDVKAARVTDITVWVIGVSTLFFTLTSQAAQPDWSLCGPEPVTLEAAPLSTPLSQGQMKVFADALTSGGQESLLFDGGVELYYDGESLRADHVKAWREPRRVEAQGNIELRQQAEGLFIRADAATLLQDQSQGMFQNVEYAYTAKHLFGKAKSVTHKDGVLELDQASYSTCRINNPDWKIRAGRIRLDQKRGMGFATHALFTFKRVPLLYLPWITFPVGDQRRTGFLYPEIGSSDTGGFEASLPFYWNIAPQLDMTITPRWMERRGTMFEDELRYLGAEFSGRLTADYIKRDKVTGQERYQYSVDHKSRFGRHWDLSLGGGYVSDGDYFVDFSSGLNESSQTHLERHADLRYDDRFWTGLIRSQVYQTLDQTIPEDDRPYRRLPQVALQGDLPLFNEHLGVQTSLDFTRFSHDSRVAGNRFDVNTSLSYSWLEPGAYIKPKLSWRQTWYDLEATADTPSHRLDRGLPVTSVDSGLVFERQDETQGIATLEPRLFYVYTPYRDQSEIPVFDSNEPAFIFSSLFRENRFNGLDRIGDTSQLTAALTSRYFSGETGIEVLNASFGQIHYFQDRRVTLPDTPIETLRRSDYAAEFNYTPQSPWSARMSLIASEDLRKTRVATASVAYRGAGNRIANLEHRFRSEDDINQTNLSAAWPFNARWRGLGRWLYSQSRGRDLELLLGLEYESCCWKARFTARRYILDEQEDYNVGYFLQLILKGLGSFGQGQSLIEQSITGYRLNDQ